MCHCKTLCKVAIFVKVRGLGKRNIMDAKAEIRNANFYVLFTSFSFVYTITLSEFCIYIGAIYSLKLYSKVVRFFHLTLFTYTTIRKCFLFYFILDFYIYMHNWVSFIYWCKLNMNYAPVTVLVPQKLLMTKIEKNSCPIGVYVTAGEKTIKTTSTSSAQFSALLLLDLLVFFSTLQHFLRSALEFSQVFFSGCSFSISFAGSFSSFHFLLLKSLNFSCFSSL